MRPDLRWCLIFNGAPRRFIRSLPLVCKHNTRMYPPLSLVARLRRALIVFEFFCSLLCLVLFCLTRSAKPVGQVRRLTLVWQLPSEVSDRGVARLTTVDASLCPLTRRLPGPVHSFLPMHACARACTHRLNLICRLFEVSRATYT